MGSEEKEPERGKGNDEKGERWRRVKEGKEREKGKGNGENGERKESEK